MSTDRTRVYVDGFNLYYGAFRDGTFGAYKWLNLVGFCQDIPPQGTSYRHGEIFHGTGEAQRDRSRSPRASGDLHPSVAHAPRDQHPHGTFSTHPKIRPVADPAAHCQPAVEVIITEEKGSDVNLATYLLLDAFDDTLDTAVVISDDSDLLEPIKVVKERFDRRIVVIRIRTNRGSVFKNVADAVYDANRSRYYSQSQLPATLTSPSGKVINRPSGW